jgi:acetyl esterase/lipase
MKKITSTGVALAFFVIANAQTTRYQDKIFVASQIEKSTVKYSSALNEDGVNVDLYCDVYQPRQSLDTCTKRPAIIFVHGGGFEGGSKSDGSVVTRAKQWFAFRGYVAVSIDYRLTSAVRDPIAQQGIAMTDVTDAQAAVRFLRQNFSAYHIDSNKIGMYGSSAGAIISLMTGISSELATTMGSVYDLPQPMNTSNPHHSSWVKTCFSEAGLIYDDYRAANLDPADAPSFYDFHGKLDSTVSFTTAEATKDDIIATGLEFGYHYYDNLGHLEFPTDDLESESVQHFYDNLVSNVTNPGVFYADADKDGYGDPEETAIAEIAPAGFVGNNTDCNDANANVHPGATDVCNAIDDNCNGITDENAITATISPANSSTACNGTPVTLTANTGTAISYQWKKGSVAISGATNSTFTTTIANTYKVTETNSYGCSSTSASTTISIGRAPNATVTPLSNLDICKTGSVVLQATNNPANKYQWIKGNNNIAGATNQTYTASSTGTYKVTVTNTGGCSKTSSGVTVTNSCKDDVTDQQMESNVTIYPNPATGKFTVEVLNGEPSGSPVSLEIVNIVGEKIYAATIDLESDTKQEITLPYDAPKGIYVVRVNLGNEIISRQLVYH